MRNIDKLEKLAQKATPGPWDLEKRDQEWGAIDYILYNVEDVAQFSEIASDNHRRNALYLQQCSPDKILMIISEYKAMQSLIKSFCDYGFPSKKYGTRESIVEIWDEYKLAFENCLNNLQRNLTSKDSK